MFALRNSIKYKSTKNVSHWSERF